MFQCIWRWMQARTKCPVCQTYMHLSRKDIKAVDVFALYPEMGGQDTAEYCPNLQLPAFAGPDLPAVHTTNEKESKVVKKLKNRVKAMKHCSCQGCEIQRRITSRDYRFVLTKDMSNSLKSLTGQK